MLPVPPSQDKLASFSPSWHGKLQEETQGTVSSPPPPRTYLQEVVSRVLVRVQLDLQESRPPAVKGSYGPIYGVRAHNSGLLTPRLQNHQTPRGNSASCSTWEHVHGGGGA